MLRESGANYFLDSGFRISIADYRILDLIRMNLSKCLDNKA